MSAYLFFHERKAALYQQVKSRLVVNRFENLPNPRGISCRVTKEMAHGHRPNGFWSVDELLSFPRGSVMRRPGGGIRTFYCVTLGPAAGSVASCVTLKKGVAYQPFSSG